MSPYLAFVDEMAIGLIVLYVILIYTSIFASGIRTLLFHPTKEDMGEPRH